MIPSLMYYLVSSFIAGEIILFGILQVAKQSGARIAAKGLGWFYFALCLGLFGMAGTSFMAYIDTNSRLRDLDTVGARYLAATDLVLTVRDMEASQRGFLLTGRYSYLEPYRQGLKDLPARYEALRRAYRDAESIERPARVEQVIKLTEAKVRELDAGIKHREDHHDAPEQLSSDVEKTTSSLVRIAIWDLMSRDRGRYNQIKAGLIHVAETRIGMAALVALGAVVQMWLGAFGAWRIAHPEALTPATP